jgi:prepilin-type processing-associated H-X9-DG protein
MSFSKKDVVVTFVCVVFLLAALGAVGSSGRRRAKEAVCLSNLRQWGRAFLAFTGDNDGYFMKGWTNQQVQGPLHKRYWMEALRPYYDNPDLRCCPEASIPGTEIGSSPWGISGTFTGWGVFSGECGEPSTSWAWVVGCDYGSYGINGWVSNIEEGWNLWLGKDVYWRTPNVAGAENIPLFGDHHFLDCWPNHTDEPPAYDGQNWGQAGQMGRVCMNRHNGFVNWVFLDGSTRKVGLKELWRLKWHREYDVGYPPPAWPEWMQDFEDY